MARPRITAARVYDDTGADDGARVLVDRLWPRGLRKADAHVDVWLKEAAPSKELRTWYGHAPERHEEFVQRYRAELADDAHAEAVARLRRIAGEGRVTLLTATRDLGLSQASVLAAYLTEKKG